MPSLIDPTTVEPGALCAALFDIEIGTGVCESFGPHSHHGGVLRQSVFRCHRCRFPIRVPEPVGPPGLVGAHRTRCSQRAG